jgi:tetratricopeptide (TPR) repeat protein
LAGRLDSYPAGRQRWRATLRGSACALLLAALAVAVYAPVRHHEFVDWDDFVEIVNNPHLAPGLGARAALEAFTRPWDGVWIPLTRLSLLLDRSLYGLAPRGYLLGNLALHVLASVALCLGLLRMTGATGRSLFVAALFAVHPLHVESVAWATERKDVLCGALWMAALWAHAARAERPGRARGALVAALGALAMLAKPMAVTLPLSLLLLDAWPLRRLGWRSLREQLPLLLAAAGVSGVTLLVQREAGFTGFGEQLPLAARLANAVDSLAVYALDSAWPSGLAAFYPHPGASLAPARVAAAAAFAAGATLAAGALRRRAPWLAMGWAWYVVTLVPVLGIVQVGEQARADRYTYVPMVGLAIAFAWSAAEAARSPATRRLLAVGAAAALAALALAARVQVGHWRDSVAVFERMLAVGPDHPLPHQRLAAVYLRAGELERAERHYRRAYELAPAQGRASLLRFERGMAAQRLARGDEAAALERYRRALALEPADPSARRALALLLAEARDARLRDPVQALRLADALCAELPGEPALLDVRAAALAAAGRREDALRDARAGLALAREAGNSELAALLERRLTALGAAAGAEAPATPARTP